MPKTLLLADDSVTIQKVVGITFANEDVELVTVDNGTDALAKAKVCDPSVEIEECTMVAASSIQCGCPTSVNRNFDLASFDRLAQTWSALACGAGVLCGACPAPPSGGTCSPEGSCVDVFSE